MKKMVIVLMVCLFFGGQIGAFASSKPSHLNPEKRAYRRPLIGATCDQCYNTFMISGEQLDSVEIGNCPYCGAKQNLKDAVNRYGRSKAVVK